MACLRVGALGHEVSLAFDGGVVLFGRLLLVVVGCVSERFFSRLLNLVGLAASKLRNLLRAPFPRRSSARFFFGWGWFFLVKCSFFQQ